MKKIQKYISILCIVFLFLVISVNINSYANEPIMEYKFTVEQQKVKRAEFIWRICIEKLRQEKVLSNTDAKAINKYISDKMENKRYEAHINKYKYQKNALKIKNVDNIVSKNIITKEQGEILKKELSKYNLNNLEY
ncbi:MULTISPECIES: hypothetical protein [unclassified Romboutsia]|uniref:hypothetical protein n=1 Tax=unclassified Romboutsia TaxID=2626894 RepID=UPI001896E4BB|nr:MULTISPECIES: hypothetical protein [unclassified Romboutsia]MDB8804917.1 hypothetical protein [Romboutsia sp. 1001216sp1]MDB8808549.1 hypothetical protein [Romboutsia sp. 1001216sp1]MDB8810562.1 hypothetical protein [Romboutsia sp. 1001216sp1]MDB8816282.1 hypothetical protein [Romboutsia sp. 1001216sp1]MDB8818765.1 hypothetical protein [Romboutsia sp. 1001216sp1]